MERSEIDRLLEELHPSSWGWALACCDRNRDDAEEVLQMAYLKVMDGRARYDGRSAFKTWLFAVIRKTALEYWRWGRVRRRLREVFIPRVAEQDDETRVVHRERSRQLIAALGRLARRQREVLELVFYHDMTIEAAAATLGISAGAARVHYDRGKKKIREVLSGE